MSDDVDFANDAELTDVEIDEHERFWNLVDRICDQHGLPKEVERPQAKQNG